MNKENLHTILQYALLCAMQNDDWIDQELGSIHLIKYAYLADLIYAKEHDGVTYTGVDWKFHNFGPWAAAVHDEIPKALNAINATAKPLPSSFGKEDYYRYSYKADDCEELYEKRGNQVPSCLTFQMRQLVKTFGKDTPKLLDHVYNTKPMLLAAPGDTLKFSVLVEDHNDTKNKEFVSSMDTLSKKKQKKLKERLREIREEKLKEKSRPPRRKLISSKLPPIEDDVLQKGLEYLDSLLGAPLPRGRHEVEFDDSVWNSSVRGMERF